MVCEENAADHNSPGDQQQAVVPLRAGTATSREWSSIQRIVLERCWLLIITVVPVRYRWNSFRLLSNSWRNGSHDLHYIKCFLHCLNNICCIKIIIHWTIALLSTVSKRWEGWLKYNSYKASRCEVAEKPSAFQKFSFLGVEKWIVPTGTS